MSTRLDRHIGTVRNKLAVEQFLLGLGYAVAIFFAAVLIHVLVDRLLWVRLPRAVIWFWSGLGAALAGAIGFAIFRRPSALQAATFIDEKLGLKEKFSTALFARHGTDPFALAAVKDAERTADNVSLHRRFPIAFPFSGMIALCSAAVVLLVVLFLPRVDLFGRQEKLEAQKKAAMERATAQHQAQSVLAAVNSLPVAMQSKQKVELAKQELQHVLDEPTVDPSIVKLTAQKAQEEAETARQEEIKNNQAFAQALADKAVFNSLNPSSDDKGPVADATRAISNGDFSKAIDELAGLPEKFNQMSPEEQKKAADQMQAAAQQLEKIANDPAAMQHLQQQLQQQGVNPQQVQQMAKAIQQAAAGNLGAQQQIQQMQQQMAQQMNGGKGPTQQQQQAISKAIQQMQSVAKSQSTAQQLTSGAQQMAQGMQMAQAARQGSAQAGQAKAGAGQQAGAQRSGGQQPGGQQGASQQANAGGQQPGGQQPGGQQASAGGQQPGGQQGGGQQPGGQQGGGSGQQQMQQAGQQMAQALGQMDAVQKDAQEQAVARNNPDQGGANQPGDGAGQGGQGQNGGGQGQWKPGQPGNQQGQGGAGGPGPGGGKGQTQLAQFSVKQELDPSQNISNGKLLAKSFVKADQLNGKSTIQLSTAAKAAVKESTDDVSEDTVPKDAQKAVKDYFDNVGTDH
jgi:hypothetical protein